MEVWLADGTKTTVEGVETEELDEPTTVYNFEVEDFHTYYVGENSVLVHNDCGPQNGQLKSNAASDTSHAQPNGKTETTADLISKVELKDGNYYAPKSTIDEIGQIEARGEDFSLLNKSVISERLSTEGGASIVYRYGDAQGTKYIVHEVTNPSGYVLHRDFDAVRILSGQVINKKHKEINKCIKKYF